MGPHEQCTDTDPEAHAGEPVDDGWDEPRWAPDEDATHTPIINPSAFDDFEPIPLQPAPGEADG
jgi:hypothetical protein